MRIYLIVITQPAIRASTRASLWNWPSLLQKSCLRVAALFKRKLFKRELLSKKRPVSAGRLCLP